MLVTKFQLDAMSRADIPEKERTDFYLYVDEFQNFATDSFATILSEARKYKLNLVMANQYIAQMSEVVS
jgi:type IV secretory pathway TraG/TraD family ATPase VirD4